EVGDERVDRAEDVPGTDEEVGQAGAGDDAVALGGDGLERARGGRADGDDAAPRGFRRGDRGGGVRGNDVGLGVQPVLRDVVEGDGPEGAGADVEGDVGAPDAA